jgi:hypothetical protein
MPFSAMSQAPQSPTQLRFSTENALGVSSGSRPRSIRAGAKSRETACVGSELSEPVLSEYSLDSVHLTLRTILVARSNARDTTKGGHADLIPIAAPLFPILKHQLEHAPGSLVFPAANGSQRSAEADPQKILRTALARAGLVEGYEHVCRWCSHRERHADNEQRYCPKCLKRTNGTGKPLAQPRGRALWPKAIPRPMRFHDLRHTTATLLLRAGVDAHRVQRLLRHRDVRTTTMIYGHLDVEDLRAALEKLPQLGPNWVQAAQTESEPLTDVAANTAESGADSWWALQDSNLRPLPCEGSALPLS